MIMLPLYTGNVVEFVKYPKVISWAYTTLPSLLKTLLSSLKVSDIITF